MGLTSDQGASGPRFLELSKAELATKVETARAELELCRACPRNCEVDRLADEIGVCRTGRRAVVSSAFPHFGEEACLRGWRGSGTIFFSHCNLRCVFCQNWDISQNRQGSELDASEIAELMLELQSRGCHNINFVTPEHVVPQLVEAIARSIERGLSIPIVYNTSAYDSLSSLRLLDGLVDIYMPDFKFWLPATAHRLAAARDYPEIAREAIREMHRQVGLLALDRRGIAFKGVLVRHLVMPGQGQETHSILAWLAEEISTDTWVNLMGQYRPAWKVGQVDEAGKKRFAEIDCGISRRQMEAAYASARRVGLHRLDGPAPAFDQQVE